MSLYPAESLPMATAKSIQNLKCHRRRAAGFFLARTFSWPTLFFVLHDRFAAATLHMPPKRSSDAMDGRGRTGRRKLKKREKGGFGGRGRRKEEGWQCGGTPPSSKPLHEARGREKPFLCSHTRDLAEGEGCKIAFFWHYHGIFLGFNLQIVP